MTGNDYQVVADIIRTLPKTFGIRNTVAQRFAEKLKQRNQRFNATKFIEACGPLNQDDDE